MPPKYKQIHPVLEEHDFVSDQAPRKQKYVWGQQILFSIVPHQPPQRKGCCKSALRLHQAAA